ncbi:tRNA:m(4)X modification enzyme TRM13 homolog isoform X2 [Leptidea sinapis]|uniref:tRNA:m(4)X modification enzyme TRM13 homolog isoform X2 n=1 Tax=Leptidea sinapis TaxID=189913 RepID=UPI0021C477C4|nr:tRNA:m(4)X modification enzyme TRM13 homolog isoform X2 [Leptidea sinapis]
MNDTRVPCPYDPKHTCFANKLDKHLRICNARQQENPEYIETNINSPAEPSNHRQPLKDVPLEILNQVIDKINVLYEKYIEGNIEELSEREIHSVLREEYMQNGRTESSLRHLRQVSQLMWIVEDEGLVNNNTCYVELGAGKGHLSYFAWQAWCTQPTRQSCVLLVERAALRHKRDNKIQTQVAKSDANHVTSHDTSEGTEARVDSVVDGRVEGAVRVRADIADLVLHLVPAVRERRSVVGITKHLCGVATDYALRCLCAAEGLSHLRGLVMSTCCHHRCQPAGYVGSSYLQALGVDAADLCVMLGVVSWATCGDGRPRAPPPAPDPAPPGPREVVGRRAKLLLDWGRVLYLRERGLNARLTRYVAAAVSPENVCIVATNTQ